MSAIHLLFKLHIYGWLLHSAGFKRGLLDKPREMNEWHSEVWMTFLRELLFEHVHKCNRSWTIAILSHSQFDSTTFGQDNNVDQESMADRAAQFSSIFTMFVLVMRPVSMCTFWTSIYLPIESVEISLEITIHPIGWSWRARCRRLQLDSINIHTNAKCNNSASASNFKFWFNWMICARVSAVIRLFYCFRFASVVLNNSEIFIFKF